jgi:sensor histidine kinase regulating citrate/malate metabolism
MKKILFIDYFLVIAIITAISGIIYATVQQTYRSGANDPQIQIARDINSKLQQGKPVENFFADTIDIAQSLSVFNVLYDDAGKPIRSSGYLQNKMPGIPVGVFEFAKKNGEHDVTWQPQAGVRMAMVIVSSNSSPVGFVASGRSLQEVEIREHNLITIIFFGWIICIALVLLHAVLNFYSKPKVNSKNI